MENLIQKRKEIINGYKGYIINSKRIPEKKQITHLKFNLIFYVIIGLLLNLLLFITTIAIVFKLNYRWINWEEAGLICLFGMTTAIQIPILIQDKYISKKKAQIQDIEISSESNKKLADTIIEFNKRRKYIFLYGLPLIVVVLAAFFQVFNNQEYWSYFPPIVLIVCFYSLIYNLLIYFRIKSL